MAFILPDLSSTICVSKLCFRYSYVLILIPLIIGLLYLFIRRNMITLHDKSEQQVYASQKKHQRIIYFIIRSLLIVVLLIAISSPFLLQNKTVQGNPRVTLLIDNSTSMNMYDGTIAKKLEDALKTEIPLTVRTIASGDKSALGNGILNNIERNENVLVISDGNNNDGKLLGDIILLAASLNATVSTLKMDSINSDVAVEIVGPSEAIRDTEEAYAVQVNNVGSPIPYHLEVRFDNEVVLSVNDQKSNTFTFRKKLTEGYHRISAELQNVGGSDYFSQNNRFYKSVKVVPRPKVLFVSEKSSLLANQLGAIYDLDQVASLPSDLSSYLAVIMNDIPVNKFAPHVDKLSDYVSDGNGLLVIGGQTSYDRGGYKGTLVETLLPVKVGAGEESEKNDVHIIIVIDVSGTTGVVFNTNTGQYEVRGYDDVIKAQAVSVVDSLDSKNTIGVIVTGARDVGAVTTLSELVTLKDHKSDIITKIARIDRNKVGGQTIDVKYGIDKAHKMLRDVSGAKNIIVISDGRGLAPRPQLEVLDSISNARSSGVKTYAVGVGAETEQASDFLIDIANTGGGIYFPVNAQNKLKIIFGEPEGKDEQESLNSLVLLDTTHFITFNQSIDAIISGYNYMIPKPSSRLLITTNKNIPVMAVWRFGLGRVVSLGTDDGGKWGGEMLQKDNSKILTKSLNWAIGDLSRKKNFDVKIRDTTLDGLMHVDVTASSMPQDPNLVFVKTDVGSYSATFEPKDVGFVSFLGADAAINYKQEFLELGQNNEFKTLVQQTQGQVFEPTETEAILDFIREKSKRISVNTTDFKWPLIILVILLFLLDIGIRRLWENQNAR